MAGGRLRMAILALAATSAGGEARGQGVAAPGLAGIFPPGLTVGATTELAIDGRPIDGATRLVVAGGGVEVVGFIPDGDRAAKARVRVDRDARPGFREARLDGPGGLSNLVMIRVDSLPQVVEVEPNDAPAQAQEVEAGSAVAGVLRALDVDHYQVRGRPGQRLTIDLEARRLGTAIAPVVTVFGASGAAMAQGRESPGPDRECRMGVVMPADGRLIVQVRDNIHGGNDQAWYRLRVDPAPFATALFPLGGRRGETVTVEASGGNLERPRRKEVALPDDPGVTVEPGPFDGPDGAVLAPGRLVAGDGPEVAEPAGRGDGSPVAVASGVTVNGRIGEPGEVDAYRVEVKAGDRVRARVEAAALGSSLDSVVTFRDAGGALLAENDDSTEVLRPDNARSVGPLGIPVGSADSSLTFEARADGRLTIEVADRFGEGGPEYGYRLAIGPARPDFAVTLLFGAVAANPGGLVSNGAGRPGRMTPGVFGVFNLGPGSAARINFLVIPAGRPGPVEVRVEGLPDGVTAEPVSVRLPGPWLPGDPARGPATVAPVADSLTLKVAPSARPGLHEFRVVATARPDGVALRREATATIGIGASADAARPITRVLRRFPLRILGEVRPD